MALTFDFALEGFRTVRERPKLILFWGAASLFGNGLVMLIFIHFSGGALASFMALSQSTAPDPAALSIILQDMLPGMAACFPIYFLTSAVINGAVCRAGLGEGDDRFGFLQFGINELRIFAVLVIKFVLGAAMLLACLLVATAGGAANGAQAQALALVGMAAGGCGLVWLEVRLLLSVPQTFATRRLNVFGSFPLTREAFWRLATGYGIAYALSLCVGFLCQKIIDAVLGIGFNMTKALTADTTSLQAYLTPPVIVYQCLSYGVVVPLMLAILMGAPVAAYRALTPVPGPAAPQKSGLTS